MRSGQLKQHAYWKSFFEQRLFAVTSRSTIKVFQINIIFLFYFVGCCIAWIYSAAGYHLEHWMSLCYGIGQTVFLLFVSFVRIYGTLWGFVQQNVFGDLVKLQCYNDINQMLKECFICSQERSIFRQNQHSSDDAMWLMLTMLSVLRKFFDKPHYVNNKEKLSQTSEDLFDKRETKTSTNLDATIMSCKWDAVLATVFVLEIEQFHSSG